jgi:hypothetical protein
MNFIDRLQGYFLCHTTTIQNWESIKKTTKLIAKISKHTLDDEGEPLTIQELRERHFPTDLKIISAVYFQITKQKKPNTIRLYFDPEILRDQAFVFHPNGWHFGLSDQTFQYSNVKDFSNCSLKEAFENLVVDTDEEGGEANEILILNDVEI